MTFLTNVLSISHDVGEGCARSRDAIAYVWIRLSFRRSDRTLRWSRTGKLANTLVGEYDGMVHAIRMKSSGGNILAGVPTGIQTSLHHPQTVFEELEIRRHFVGGMTLLIDTGSDDLLVPMARRYTVACRYISNFGEPVGLYVKSGDHIGIF